MEKRYMATDQFGNTYHGLIHPRKDLSEKLGFKHISKMYIDLKDGSSRHCGYVVGPHWCDVYEVNPINEEV